jgi:hypothetical protein
MKSQTYFEFISKNKKKLLTLTVLSLLSLTFHADQVIAQEDVKENFVNAGLISISDLYTLSSKTNTIVFRIKNNAARTISQIYGWVYMYDKGTDGKGTNFVLLNNPHKGGNIIKGKPHRPRKISEWSFPLLRKANIENKKISYTLRVHTRSIFFASIEPRNEQDTEPKKIE